MACWKKIGAGRGLEKFWKINNVVTLFRFKMLCYVLLYKFLLDFYSPCWLNKGPFKNDVPKMPHFRSPLPYVTFSHFFIIPNITRQIVPNFFLDQRLWKIVLHFAQLICNWHELNRSASETCLKIYKTSS